jgi:hypothetical protein
MSGWHSRSLWYFGITGNFRRVLCFARSVGATTKRRGGESRRKCHRATVYALLSGEPLRSVDYTSDNTIAVTLRDK